MGMMGSRSSVIMSDTFLTAYDYDSDDNSNERNSAENDEDKTHFTSVGTEEYNPPPNEYCSDFDFDAYKRRHYQLKERYVRELHDHIVAHIPQSIKEAKFISSKQLKYVGGQDQYHKYAIDPDILAHMKSRASWNQLIESKKSSKQEIDLILAGRNKLTSYRHGAGKVVLPCTTFMDTKPNEFQNSMDYMGINEITIMPTCKKNKAGNEPEDSSSIVEFRKFVSKGRKRAVRTERKKATFIERYQRWKQEMKEKYVDYDYEKKK